MRLHEAGFNAYMEACNLEESGFVYRVRLRGGANVLEARKVTARLREQGFDDFFIVNPSENEAENT